MQPQKNLIKIAVIQMTSTSNTIQNFSHISSCIEKASANNAKMAFLPENFHFMRSKDLWDYQDLTGPAIQSYQELAKIHKIWLSLGGFQERIPSSTKYYNAHIIIDINGEIKSVYRKIHLFDVDIDSKNIVRESNIAEPGPVEPNVVETPLGRLGLSVCYDVRFPELYRKEVIDLKADFLAIPAAFLVPTGKAHWELLLRARAVENTCFVIAAAQCGKHHENRSSYGHSMVIDPWGEVLLDMGEEIGVGFVDIDVDRIQEIRGRLPCLKHQKLGKY